MAFRSNEISNICSAADSYQVNGSQKKCLTVFRVTAAYLADFRPSTLTGHPNPAQEI
jgi:hypothetical protein